ncbi:MAG: dipeptidyl-peptidase 3 family protein [Terriglobales bacterium]
MRTLAFLLCFFPLLMIAQDNNPSADELNKMAARFAPTPINVDTSKLSTGDKQALVKLIEAARVINPLFMQQIWSKNLETWTKVKGDDSPLGKARAHYYWINKMPWDSLNALKAFMPGVPERKPLGANFYPEDMTKEEFESWVKTLPEAQQQEATGFFTVIRRDENGKLKLVPYSEEYKSYLDQAGALLREAAKLTDNATLKKFCETRAAAFDSNSYYESDVAWMDVDAPIDITFGPYETYNDELFNYKAAFETYITVRDEAESNKLKAFAGHLQEIENNLPEDPQFRNPKLGAAAPIRVVNSVFSSGDGDHGVQTAAYNLPNDEKVVAEKGAKRVMLKNIQEAKFQKVLIPISKRTLSKPAQADVAFEPFFTHILAHELMHGLGPQQIKVNGKQTSPRQQLKELYSSIEEAKADATGLFALQYMMDHAKEMQLDGVLKSDEAAQRQLYTTFLASTFRTLRFGIHEAHGKGMAFQFNYLLDKGGFVQNADGTFEVDYAKIKGAVRDLTRTLLMLEANGDYDAAKKMLDQLVVIRPGTEKMLDQLNDIPVDIEPQYVMANELAPADIQTTPERPARPSRH